MCHVQQVRWFMREVFDTPCCIIYTRESQFSYIYILGKLFSSRNIFQALLQSVLNNRLQVGILNRLIFNEGLSDNNSACNFALSCSLISIKTDWFLFTQTSYYSLLLGTPGYLVVDLTMA